MGTKQHQNQWWWILTKKKQQNHQSKHLALMTQSPKKKNIQIRSPKWNPALVFRGEHKHLILEGWTESSTQTSILGVARWSVVLVGVVRIWRLSIHIQSTEGGVDHQIICQNSKKHQSTNSLPLVHHWSTLPETMYFCSKNPKRTFPLSKTTKIRGDLIFQGGRIYLMACFVIFSTIEYNYCIYIFR